MQLCVKQVAWWVLHNLSRFRKAEEKQDGFPESKFQKRNFQSVKVAMLE